MKRHVRLLRKYAPQWQSQSQSQSRPDSMLLPYPSSACMLIADAMPLSSDSHLIIPLPFQLTQPAYRRLELARLLRGLGELCATVVHVSLATLSSELSAGSRHRPSPVGLLVLQIPCMSKVDCVNTLCLVLQLKSAIRIFTTLIPFFEYRTFANTMSLPKSTSSSLFGLTLPDVQMI